MRLSATVDVVGGSLCIDGLGNGQATLLDGAGNAIRSVFVIVQLAAGELSWEGFDQFIDGNDAATAGTISFACHVSSLPLMAGTFTYTHG